MTINKNHRGALKEPQGRPPRRWLLAAAAAALCVLLAMPVRAQSIEIIVAPERKDVTIDRKLLLSIYLGRVTSWQDGAPIRVFTLPDGHPLHEQFVRQQLGTYPYVLRSTWDKLVFTGTGFAPTVVTTEQEMRRRVEQTPGAIGYLTRPGQGATGAPTGPYLTSAPGPGASR